VKPLLRLVPSPPETDAPNGCSLPPTLTPLQRKRVEEGLPLVYRIAEHVAHQFHGQVTKEELLAPGTFGLYEAAQKYDEERRTDFAHFAKHYIRGRMLDSIATERFSLRARVERVMDRAWERFECEAFLEVDTVYEPEEVIAAAERECCGDSIAAALLAALLEVHGQTPEEDVLAAEEQRVAKEMLKKAFASLYPLEKEVLRLIYEQGMTLDEVAKATRVHAVTAQRRHVKVLRKLRAFLLATRPSEPVWSRLEGAVFKTG